MKTKAIGSFFVLFAIAAGMMATSPAAFADHSEVTIVPAAGSGALSPEEWRWRGIRYDPNGF